MEDPDFEYYETETWFKDAGENSVETLLKIVEKYKNKNDDIEKSFEKLIMERLFSELPENKALGKRIRVEIKGTNINNNTLGPLHDVTIGGMSDLAQTFTREISINLNIIFVYPAKKKEIGE